MCVIAIISSSVKQGLGIANWTASNKLAVEFTPKNRHPPDDKSKQISYITLNIIYIIYIYTEIEIEGERTVVHNTSVFQHQRNYYIYKHIYVCVWIISRLLD